MTEPYGVAILAVAPHPDDAEMFCSGLLLTAADRGQKTGILDLTRGEMSSNGTLESRAAETAQASAVLGLHYRENLHLPDAWLHPYAGYEAPPQERPQTPLARVVEAIRRLRPEILLLPWSEDRHPDHVAGSELATKAVFFAGLRTFETSPPSERFSPRQVLYYPLRYAFRPSFVVDISGVFERKKQAILCYQSQFQRSPAQIATLINSPLALEAIEARDRYYGAQIGRIAGEAYFCSATLCVSDPVGFFRQESAGSPHFFERLP